MIVLQNAVSALGLNASELATGAAALFSMALNWRFAASISAMKLEIKTESDSLRKEISTQLSELRKEFVPRDGDVERRSSLDTRIALALEETEKNRERIHIQNNRMMEIVIGPIHQLTNSLSDINRRLSEIDHRGRQQDQQIHEHDMRITGLEREDKHHE